MKGMILAAGRGTRLRPLTLTRSKPMIPVANQPLISYPLGSMCEAGISEITVVAGENRDELERGLGELNLPARLFYAVQDAPLGLAHAVQSAHLTCQDSDFMLLFCDNLFSAPLAGAVADWERLQAREPKLAALIHVIEVEDPRAFGVAEVDGDWVVGLEEKPANPKTNLAVVGIDIFKPLIFEAIQQIKPSARGELEITDAIQELVNMDFKVYARRLEGFWYDTGTFGDLIEVLTPVMDHSVAYPVHGAVLDCTVSGPLGVAAGARLANCHITGPVLIGRGAQVVDCELGPYVAVGADARLEGCALEQVQVYPGTARSGLRIGHALVDHEHVLSAESIPQAAH